MERRTAEAAVSGRQELLITSPNSGRTTWGRRIRNFTTVHPIAMWLRVNRRLWAVTPEKLRRMGLIQTYGRLLHWLVCSRTTRRQNHGTFFFRNRPQLELIGRLAGRTVPSKPGALRIAVLGCSKGAEVYSLVWVIRKYHPALALRIQAVDISEEVLQYAEAGTYRLTGPDDQIYPICSRLTEDELREMFDRAGEEVRVKRWLTKDIEWRQGDATDPHLVEVLGPQDMVVANTFLCHMEPARAELCLGKLGRLVAPGGYLVVSGVDLDVKTRVVQCEGWEPVLEDLEEIHEGDRLLREDWPFKYWGLEPLDRKRTDWHIRYATVFRIRRSTPTSQPAR